MITFDTHGSHCQHWYDNETCCWCEDPPSKFPDIAEETPCPKNPIIDGESK